MKNYFAVHILQLPKWKKEQDNITEKDRWMYLLKEGEHVDPDDPPDILKESEIMRDAMEALRDFSKNQKNFLLYQSRFQGEMATLTMERELEKERREKEMALRKQKKALRKWEKERREKEKALKEQEKALKEQEKERREKEKALKEIEELKKLLKK